MDTSKRIVLIPAYQPDTALIPFTEDLVSAGFTAVVVDDGSGAACAEIFTRLSGMEGVTVLTHEINRGKGAALKTGLRYIADHFPIPYTVVTADADGQHKVGDICRVCREAETSPEALVLGSRRFDGQVPLRSRIGNTITRTVFRLTSGAKVYDTQTGLRAFSDELVPRMLAVSGERYEYEMQVLQTAARSGIPLREIWIETVYLDGNASSHFDTVRDSFRIYREILHFSGASLLSFCLDYLLFCCFLAVSGSLVLSNVAARLISAACNYTLNRRLVFRSDAAVSASAPAYALLAALILLSGTVLLKGLSLLGISGYLAKIAVEMVMFAVSFTVQRSWVFRSGIRS